MSNNSNVRPIGNPGLPGDPDHGVRQFTERQSQDIVMRELAKHEIPETVIRTISDKDSMYTGNESMYFRIGASALDIILAALRVTDTPISEIEDILDFGCGHGRVMRFLRARFQDARLTAADLSRDAVDFCAETFGAAPFQSPVDLASLRTEEKFDLIWAGSVLTHLDEDDWHDLMSFFTKVSRPGRHVMFTTAGVLVEQLLENGELGGLEREGAGSLVASFRKTGFGYADYPYARGQNRRWGRTMVKPSWVLGFMEQYPFRNVLATEWGWAGRQDVFAWQRLDS